MSCKVMNLEPLAALANAVEDRLNCDLDFWGFEAPDSLRRELKDCQSSGLFAAEDIYRRLYALNVRAYNSRYRNQQEPGDEEAPTIDGSNYVVHHGPKYREHGYAVCPWHYQLAQLLDCWLYQTSESATRSNPLRLAMGEFRDNLYHFIIRNNPHYFSVRWGELPSSVSGKVQGEAEYCTE